MRDALLERAKELFAQRGYVAATLRDLAEVAGVTAAAMYHHFAIKESLLREIIFDRFERLSEQVVTALAGRGEPEERLEGLVRTHLRYDVEHPRESRIIIEESRFLGRVECAAARERQLGILNAYRACVRQLTASGRRGDIEAALRESRCGAAPDAVPAEHRGRVSRVK
jgi:AcrR family transcriptional regulator